MQNVKVSATSYASIGKNAFSKERWEDAIAYFKAASQLEPNNTHYLRSVAEAHFNAGDKASALAALNRVLKIAPDNEKTCKNVSRRIAEMSRPRWVNLFRRSRPFPVG